MIHCSDFVNITVTRFLTVDNLCDISILSTMNVIIIDKSQVNLIV